MWITNSNHICNFKLSGRHSQKYFFKKVKLILIKFYLIQYVQNIIILTYKQY